MARRSCNFIAALALASTALSFPRGTRADGSVCPQVSLDAHKFSPGERIVFHLDVFGADMGSMELWLDSPEREDRGKVALVAHARAKTSAFVNTNVGEYSTFTTARIGAGLAPISAREEVDESSTHWQTELDFHDGKLESKLSKNGEPIPNPLNASPSARDLLSAFYAMRASLDGLGKPGAAPLCFEIYGARKMWKMTGALGARESIDTAAGKQKTLRIDLTSTRLDDPRVVRTSKLWFGDDARHLLWAAVAEVRGKVIRAQLVSASGRGWAVGAP